jgi:hypothetical protein
VCNTQHIVLLFQLFEINYHTFYRHVQHIHAVFGGPSRFSRFDVCRRNAEQLKSFRVDAEGAKPQALDRTNHRLFVGCGSCPFRAFPHESPSGDWRNGHCSPRCHRRSAGLAGGGRLHSTCGGSSRVSAAFCWRIAKKHTPPVCRAGAARQAQRALLFRLGLSGSAGRVRRASL